MCALCNLPKFFRRYKIEAVEVLTFWQQSTPDLALAMERKLLIFSSKKEGNKRRIGLSALTMVLEALDPVTGFEKYPGLSAPRYEKRKTDNISFASVLSYVNLRTAL